MIKITNPHKRSVLAEGRNNGMAFAFLQKVGDNQFETVQPPSPCKDYLAEVLFTENYNIPTKGCGLYYKKKLNIFTDIAYMAIKMVKVMGGGYNYSPSFENDVKLLAQNYKEIERLMNEFENKLDMKILTTIEPAEKDYFLVTFSSEWCKSTHSISLFSLLLRVMMVADKSTKDFNSFCKNYTYNNWDKSFMAQIASKLALIIKEKKLPPNTRSYSKKNMKSFFGSPHNNGILAWNSSFDEVKLSD